MSPNRTAFKVFDKTPSKHPFATKKVASVDKETLLTTNFKPYYGNKRTACLQFNEYPFPSFCNTGFVKTAIDCYNGHHNLVLRPDDVWAAIMVQFSRYASRNAKEFGGKFANLNGRKELDLQFVGAQSHSQLSVGYSYDSFVRSMLSKIDEDLADCEMKKWILPSFSTTSSNDLVATGFIFMAAMKQHVHSARYTPNGGIPQITLEGTLADWKDIFFRLDKLKEYKLGEWQALLKPILKEFVNAKSGKLDVTFWKKICYYKDSRCWGGFPVISGWITAFCVFDKYGRWKGFHPLGQKKSLFKPTTPLELSAIIEKCPNLELNAIHSDIVEMQVKIANHQNKCFVLAAGHIAIELRDKYTLQPTLGWMVAEEKEKTRHCKYRGGNREKGKELVWNKKFDLEEIYE